MRGLFDLLLAFPQSVQSQLAGLPALDMCALTQNNRHFDFFFTHKHEGEYSGATTVT